MGRRNDCALTLISVSQAQSWLGSLFGNARVGRRGMRFYLLLKSLPGVNGGTLKAHQQSEKSFLQNETALGLFPHKTKQKQN